MQSPLPPTSGAAMLMGICALSHLGSARSIMAFKRPYDLHSTRGVHIIVQLQQSQVWLFCWFEPTARTVKIEPTKDAFVHSAARSVLQAVVARHFIVFQWGGYGESAHPIKPERRPLSSTVVLRLRWHVTGAMGSGYSRGPPHCFPFQLRATQLGKGDQQIVYLTLLP